MTFRSQLSIFLVVFGVATTFAAFTEHAWEDFYITYRASENLATGQGLVFEPGERLHTFTSPIGVLVPAGLRYVMGDVPPETVLWAYRLISVGCLAGGVAWLVATCIRMGIRRGPILLVAGLLAFDVKSVDFAINGMETGFLLCALTASVGCLAVAQARQGALLGLTWGLLLWCRPDAFVHFGALAAGWLLFNPGTVTPRSRRDLLGVFTRAGLVCALTYLPWLLFSYVYYGTPIPHTVTAKGLSVDRSGIELLSELVVFPFKLLTPGSPYRLLFTPAYVDAGGWPVVIRLFSYGLGAAAALLVFWPRASPRTRAFALSVFLSGFYLDAVCPFPAPWYVPATAWLAALTLGSAYDDLLGFLARRAASHGSAAALPRRLLASGAAVAILLQIGVTAAGSIQLRHQQAQIEDGVRREIGAWLKANASSARDTVFLECLGYIGYFSGLKMMDHPGLSSLEMVEARRSLRTDDWTILIDHLRPDWLVLRPREVLRMGGESAAGLRNDYRLIRRFDAAGRIASIEWVPGRPYLEADQTFLVYRRTNAPRT